MSEKKKNKERGTCSGLMEGKRAGSKKKKVIKGRELKGHLQTT